MPRLFYWPFMWRDVTHPTRIYIEKLLSCEREIVPTHFDTVCRPGWPLRGGVEYIFTTSYKLERDL